MCCIKSSTKVFFIQSFYAVFLMNLCIRFLLTEIRINLQNTLTAKTIGFSFPVEILIDPEKVYNNLTREIAPRKTMQKYFFIFRPKVLIEASRGVATSRYKIERTILLSGRG